MAQPKLSLLNSISKTSLHCSQYSLALNFPSMKSITSNYNLSFSLFCQLIKTHFRGCQKYRITPFLNKYSLTFKLLTIENKCFCQNCSAEKSFWKTTTFKTNTASLSACNTVFHQQWHFTAKNDVMLCETTVTPTVSKPHSLCSDWPKTLHGENQEADP